MQKSVSKVWPINERKMATYNVYWIGSVTLKPQKHMDGRIQPRASIQWGQTIASRALNADEYKMGILYECATAISQSRDECKVGHWVFAESSATVQCLIVYLTRNSLIV